MTVTLDLAGLQDIDDELTRVRGELADIESRIGPDKELEAARQRLTALDAEFLSEARKEKALADEADTIGARITSEEGRLYEGSVKLPKELAGLEQEIASLRARKSTIEDAALALLERCSELETERSELGAVETKLDAAWRSRQRTLREQLSGLGSEQEGLLAKRHDQTEGIAAGTLDLYEDLRRRKAGIAVSVADGPICGGCRVAMPEAVRRRVLSERQLPQCPNCERILVVR
jgi:uncharacterized protein